MKQEHNADRGTLLELQKSGIPMTVLKDEKRFAVLPKVSSASVTFALSESPEFLLKFTSVINGREE